MLLLLGGEFFLELDLRRRQFVLFALSCGALGITLRRRLVDLLLPKGALVELAGLVDAVLPVNEASDHPAEHKKRQPAGDRHADRRAQREAEEPLQHQPASFSAKA